MSHNSMMRARKLGFIGVGNMGQAVIKALVQSGDVDAKQIWASSRTARRLQKAADEFGINTFENNEELVDHCDVVFLGMKPQDLYSAIEPLASGFTDGHTVISFAAGVSLASLQKLMPQVKQIVRVIPNTPSRIGKGVVGYCLPREAAHLGPFVEAVFAPLGYVVQAQEGEEFEALTVACSSGVGFVFELMLYWQEWLEEHGFEPEVARRLTVDTFFGAAALADSKQTSPLAELQRQVASKKGVTAAGLDSMQELEVERALRYSFEKAVLRDRELGQTSV